MYLFSSNFIEYLVNNKTIEGKLLSFQWKLYVFQLGWFHIASSDITFLKSKVASLLEE